MSDAKPKKARKSVAAKYPTRQALVYSGAAFLIVIVGLRTLLSVADEGFGLIEYITLFGLALEFSMLLLYAWTIYSAGKESAKMAEEEEKRAEEEVAEETEPISINPEDIPELAAQIGRFAAKSGEIVSQLKQNQDLVARHSEEISRLNDNLSKILDEQVRLKVREEIQRILTAADISK